MLGFAGHRVLRVWAAMPLKRTNTFVRLSTSQPHGPGDLPENSLAVESQQRTSDRYLLGMSDDELAQLADGARRAMSLEIASEKERMKVETRLAMQRWQQRPGDTGSTAVQSACSGRVARAAAPC